jgi:hypothetical protein
LTQPAAVAQHGDVIMTHHCCCDHADAALVDAPQGPSPLPM